MPKTPPLLLLADPSFQDKENIPSYTSFLASLPSSSNYMLSSRSHILETVMEEEENITVEDLTNMDGEKFTAGQTNESFSQHELPPPPPPTATTTSETQSSNNQQTTNNKANIENEKDTFLRQSSTQPTQNERQSAPPEDKDANKISTRLNLAYESTLNKHQELKYLIGSFTSTLADSEIDQIDAIRDLQNYKDTLQARGVRLQERWMQAQCHAQDLLQLPPLFPRLSHDRSSQ